MSPTLTRWLVAATATGALAAVLAMSGTNGYGQDVKEDAKVSPPAGGSLSAVHCVGCHGGKNTPAYAEYEKDKKLRPTEFVMLDEYQTWATKDLHSQAYINIVPKFVDGRSVNLAAQIQVVLKPHRERSHPGTRYEVDKAAECLTCHASELATGRGLKLSEKNLEYFQTEYGVSCEACHGYAERWFAAHIRGETWRKVPAKEKEDLGQVDLRNPARRAEKCASCHIGNKAEGKFVTHEMYAAGHPPLPPFEVVTFARDAPRHSYTHRQNKALAALPADQAWHNFHYRAPATKDKPDGECPEARALALGSIATFEATMNLLAKDAADTPKDQLLDFAHFDCYACHHDLKVPSWRQARGYRGVPGRPTMKPWSTEVLQAVMDHAKAASGFKTEEATKAAEQVRQALAEMNKQFDVRPFGDPAAIAKEAAAFGPPCQALRVALNDDAAVYTPAQTEALYRVLSERLLKEGKPGADGQYVDHDAAQQAVWALNALRTELRAARGEPDVDESPAAMALNAITELRVRPVTREPVAPERLKTRLEHIAAFDPGVFLPKAREWVKER
jgi:mono/diheme cytochrome c family protein